MVQHVRKDQVPLYHGTVKCLAGFQTCAPSPSQRPPPSALPSLLHRLEPSAEQQSTDSFA